MKKALVRVKILKRRWSSLMRPSLRVVIGLATFLLGIYLFHTLIQVTPQEQEVDTFEESLHELQEHRDAHLNRITEAYKKDPVSAFNWISRASEDAEGEVFAIYDGTELVAWSDAQTPLPQDSAIFRVKSGLQLLDNGWYDVKVLRDGRHTFLGIIRIKSQYPYSNSALESQFNPALKLPFDADISQQPGLGWDVVDNEGNFYFSLRPLEVTKHTNKAEALVLILWILGMVFFLTGVNRIILHLFPGFFKWWTWLFPVVLVGIRLIILVSTPEAFNAMNIFNPWVFYASDIQPSLGDVVINQSTILFGVIFFCERFKPQFDQLRKKYPRVVLLWAALATPFVLLSIMLIVELIENLVTHSQIPFNITFLFDLNLFSFLALMAVGMACYSNYMATRMLIRSYKRLGLRANQMGVIFFVMVVICGFWTFADISGNVLMILCPAVIWSTLGWQYRNVHYNYSVGGFMLLLAMYASLVAGVMMDFETQRERVARERITERLITERDPLIEIEYQGIREDLLTNTELLAAYRQGALLSRGQLETNLQKRHFDVGWEDYKVDLYFFDSRYRDLTEVDLADTTNYGRMVMVAKEHGEPSRVTPTLYFIQDYHDQLSYVAIEPIVLEQNELGTLIALFRSKRIPSAIGFPSLLLSQASSSAFDASRYSYARYIHTKLVQHGGEFNYPTRTSNWQLPPHRLKAFVSAGGYDHYINDHGRGNVFVLSTEETTWMDRVTAFSYVFTFFGILYFIPAAIRRARRGIRRKPGLNFKIQSVLIGLVLLSLVLFTIGAGRYVSSQYDKKTERAIREKIGSVRTEISQKLGNEDELGPELDNYMEYILKKFSKVFVTDISLYSPEGEILASSRPEIFREGLLNGHMDPRAYLAMSKDNKSEFIQDETIGALDYRSAYVPFFNKDGDLLAYLNLPYFSKQEEFEQDISDLLVAIINILIFLFLLSLVVALFASNWITRPLKSIQHALKGMQIGKANRPIAYAGRDEIGNLVREYNNKLAELDEAARRLAKSEREFAWREMAKQVAHEIKNPLTPMKLSIQHFKRSFDPNDPHAREKMDQLSNSLIEQIGTLSSIASEFSNFAKLPVAQMERVNLVNLVESAVSLHIGGYREHISYDPQVPAAWILADSEMILRVFNNLILNAIQAQREGVPVRIRITTYREGDMWVTSVEDNGVGIPDSAVESIFVPNFTTKSTGSGLGLAMCKNIVEQAGGEIWFETDLRKGTTFFVSLPAET